MAEEWNALSDEEKDRYAQIAIKKNEAVALEKPHVKEKLMSYDKKGPSGSIEKNCIVDTEELSGLLNKEDSALAEMWKEKNILPRSREFDKKKHHLSCHQVMPCLSLAAQLSQEVCAENVPTAEAISWRIQLK